LWKKLRRRFIFRGNRETRAVAKEYAMRQCAISFRKWRSELNTKFVKKGLDTTKKYPKIPTTKWKTFVEQKTSEEFLSKSQANAKLAKNIYHHHLGTGGYQRAIPKWRAEEAARKVAGLPVLLEDVPERAGEWLHAQKPQESEASLSWLDPMTDEEAKNILAVVAKQKEGSFKPSRERDTLIMGLGNPEHPGRVHGISSHLG